MYRNLRIEEHYLLAHYIWHYSLHCWDNIVGVVTNKTFRHVEENCPTIRRIMVCIKQYQPSIFSRFRIYQVLLPKPLTNNMWPITHQGNELFATWRRHSYTHIFKSGAQAKGLIVIFKLPISYRIGIKSVFAYLENFLRNSGFHTQDH